LYSPLEQGAIILGNSKNPRAAGEFLALLKSPETRDLLAQYGFELPARGTH
jgi:ABC-type molybdate transport system substrate-binding protein